MMLGTFYVSVASLKTQDLVIRPLDGTANEQRSIALPSSSFIIGNHFTPFVFADAYVDEGAFRYRSNHKGELLLQVKDDAYSVDLSTDSPYSAKPAGKLPLQEYVLYTGNRHFIAYIIDKSKNVYRLERFKINQPVSATKASRL